MEARGLKPTSMTTFGQDIYRLVQHGTLHKDRKSSGQVYIITPFRNLDLPKFFGMDVDHVDDDPTQSPGLQPGYTSQNSNGANGSAPSMQTMQGLTPLHTKSNKGVNNTLKPDIKKVRGANPTSSTSDRVFRVEVLVRHALDAGCTDLDEVIDWVRKNFHKGLTRREADRWLKRLYRPDSSKA